MNEKLELYKAVQKSAEVAEFLEENRKAFARCEDRQKNHRANYSYAVDSGFFDGCRPAYSQDPEKVVLRHEARAEEAREAEVPCGMRTLTPEPPAAALSLCG